MPGQVATRAREYLSHGWAPIPVPIRKKIPVLKGWEKLRISEGEVDRYFNGDGNISVLLGDPSNGLVDLDLDRREAKIAAQHLAHPTGVIFGRRSNRHSHLLYRATDAAGVTRQFDLPRSLHSHIRPGEKARIIEYRATGGQTVFPGSIHEETGEEVEWEKFEGEPGEYAGADILLRTKLIAAAVVMGLAWPPVGKRHTAAMVLAGSFMRAIPDLETAEHFMRAVCAVAGDDEIDDRVEAVRSTLAKMESGSPTSGWKTLRNAFAKDVVDELAKLLDYKPANDRIQEVYEPGDFKKQAEDEVARSGEPDYEIMEDIEERAVEPLWPKVFYLGKINVIVGDPGLGKSFLSCWIAATITNGRPFPGETLDDHTPIRTPGSVIILNAEDDPADTIRPRLRHADADLKKIAVLKGRKNADGTTAAFTIQDVHTLEKMVDLLPDCRLIIIDPISAYMGKVDSNNNSEVRGALAGLATLASQRRIAVICVTHMNKSGQGKAVYRAMGSLALTAAARSTWCVVKGDPEQDGQDEDMRLFVCAKNNLGPDRHGYAYRLGGDPFRLHWESGWIEMSADEALTPAGKTPGPKPEKVEAAKRFIIEQLYPGPLAAKTLGERAKEAGISAATLGRAKHEIGVSCDPIPGGAGYSNSLPKHLQKPEKFPDTFEGLPV